MLNYPFFLILFVIIPLIVGFILFIGIVRLKQSNNQSYFPTFQRIGFLIFLLALIAVIYTTPWDNYLVASEVWSYDPDKILGIIIGYVPFEEYMFFILQTFLIGLTFILIYRQFSGKISKSKESVMKMGLKNLLVILPVLSIWVISLVTFFSQIESLNYLNLILLWALPPISVQLLFGADILWEMKIPVSLTIGLGTIYFAITDAIAIQDGIWEISPFQTINILLGGILPIEEFTFFLVTNVLITFGLSLLISQRSYERITGIQNWIKTRL
ncbi:lycopene cyclase domain-containing protein [Candidatus Hodarchaeum mangrovi]